MLSLIDINRMFPGLGVTMQRHRHAHWELILCGSGCYRVEVAGQEHEGRQGAVFVYPPQLWHRPRLESGAIFLLLQWHDDRPSAGGMRCLDDHAGHLLALLDWLLAERMAGHRDGPVVQNLLAAVVAVVERGSVTPVVPEQPDLDADIRRVVRHIRWHFAEALDLEQLAGIAGLSRWELVRRFGRQFGITPAAFVRRTRLHAARNLLRAGCAWGETLRRSGYTSTPALRRALRQEFGGVEDHVGPTACEDGDGPYQPTMRPPTAV